MINQKIIAIIKGGRAVTRTMVWRCPRKRWKGSWGDENQNHTHFPQSCSHFPKPPTANTPRVAQPPDPPPAVGPPTRPAPWLQKFSDNECDAHSWCNFKHKSKSYSIPIYRHQFVFGFPISLLSLILTFYKATGLMFQLAIIAQNLAKYKITQA